MVDRWGGSRMEPTLIAASFERPVMTSSGAEAGPLLAAALDEVAQAARSIYRPGKPFIRCDLQDTRVTFRQ